MQIHMLDGIRLLRCLSDSSINVRIFPLAEFFSQKKKVGKGLSRGTIFDVTLVTRPCTTGHVGEMRDDGFSPTFFHVHCKVVVELLESVCRHELRNRKKKRYFPK